MTSACKELHHTGDQGGEGDNNNGCITSTALHSDTQWATP